MEYFGDSFKDTIYFFAGLPLPTKYNFYIGEVGVTSVLLKEYLMVSEGLPIDYSFLGVLG